MGFDPIDMLYGFIIGVAVSIVLILAAQCFEARELEAKKHCDCCYCMERRCTDD